MEVCGACLSLSSACWDTKWLTWKSRLHQFKNCQFSILGNIFLKKCCAGGKQAGAKIRSHIHGPWSRLQQCLQLFHKSTSSTAISVSRMEWVRYLLVLFEDCHLHLVVRWVMTDLLLAWQNKGRQFLLFSSSCNEAQNSTDDYDVGIFLFSLSLVNYMYWEIDFIISRT